MDKDRIDEVLSGRDPFDESNMVDDDPHPITSAEPEKLPAGR